MSQRLLYKIGIFALICVFCPILLFGCSQSLNELESEIVGKWKFSNFYVVDNETSNSISYININSNASFRLNSIVKEIGDYYSNSILELSSSKTSNKLDGTYLKNNKLTEIKWWCPEKELKIGFDNFTIYSIQGTRENPIKEKVDLGICFGNTNNELMICYRTHVFSSYIKFVKL